MGFEVQTSCVTRTALPTVPGALPTYFLLRFNCSGAVIYCLLFKIEIVNFCVDIFHFESLYSRHFIWKCITLLHFGERISNRKWCLASWVSRLLRFRQIWSQGTAQNTYCFLGFHRVAIILRKFMCFVNKKMAANI